MHNTTIRKTVFLTRLRRYMSLSRSFISSMVLARLISLKEGGIYSLVAAVVALVHLHLMDSHADPARVADTQVAKE